jgi:hypothetical protein
MFRLRQVEKADHNLSLIHLPRFDLVPWLIFPAMAVNLKALSLTLFDGATPRVSMNSVYPSQ